jgi:hypothetical protein
MRSLRAGRDRGRVTTLTTHRPPRRHRPRSSEGARAPSALAERRLRCAFLAQRTEDAPLALVNPQVVDARFTSAHQPVLVELPQLVPAGIRDPPSAHGPFRPGRPSKHFEVTRRLPRFSKSQIPRRGRAATRDAERIRDPLPRANFDTSAIGLACIADAELRLMAAGFTLGVRKPHKPGAAAESWEEIAARVRRLDDGRGNRRASCSDGRTPRGFARAGVGPTAARPCSRT